ncbi:MAG TPA: hypothetical protein VKA64_04930, partial [Gammaproteobacteria bacterium]|nr:hypothetical protein [Gammaproteobacteria bacterium]
MRRVPLLTAMAVLLLARTAIAHRVAPDGALWFHMPSDQRAALVAGVIGGLRSGCIGEARDAAKSMNGYPLTTFHHK